MKGVKHILDKKMFFRFFGSGYTALFFIVFLSTNMQIFSQQKKNISPGDYYLLRVQSKHKSYAYKKSYSAPTVVFRFLIRIFQLVFSPQDGPSCPYTPTCSAYGRQAIARHGFLKGTMLTADRLIRCNPSTKGGKDPVPP